MLYRTCPLFKLPVAVPDQVVEENPVIRSGGHQSWRVIRPHDIIGIQVRDIIPRCRFDAFVPDYAAERSLLGYRQQGDNAMAQLMRVCAPDISWVRSHPFCHNNKLCRVAIVLVPIPN